ncbi:Alpha/beta-hydrolase lipase region [Tyrophagus putrescentiae]|nr:Alpha/beta-hydrolase lipase region [Tyrophagus putrescentiae]
MKFLFSSAVVFLLLGVHFLLLLLLPPGSDALIEPQDDERRTFGELILSRGYVLIQHKVVTDDNYIITLDRVVRPGEPKGKPVVLFHGIWCQSSVFFVNSPEDEEDQSEHGPNLGFALLEAGYDLWLPNARGNGISDEHLNMSTWNTKFWEFSYEHIGLHDIPAVLDFVLTETRQKTVGWVGYSQGGQSLLALLALKPEYADKVHPFIGLAATSYMGNANSVYFIAHQPIRFLLEALPMPYLGSEPILNWITQLFCRPEYNLFGLPPDGTTGICKVVYDLMFGPNHNLNQTHVPVFMHFLPKRCSNWQMAHNLQAISSGRWQQFDYDSGHIIKTRNKEVYGSDEAPDYPWKNIKKSLKAVMMYGNLDALNQPKDAKKLVDQLKGNGVDISGVQIEGDWNHWDFFGGIGAGKKVYDKVIDILDKNIEK